MYTEQCVHVSRVIAQKRHQSNVCTFCVHFKSLRQSLTEKITRSLDQPPIIRNSWNFKFERKIWICYFLVLEYKYKQTVENRNFKIKLNSSHAGRRKYNSEMFQMLKMGEKKIGQKSSHSTNTSHSSTRFPLTCHQRNYTLGSHTTQGTRFICRNRTTTTVVTPYYTRYEWHRSTNAIQCSASSHIVSSNANSELGIRLPTERQSI